MASTTTHLVGQGRGDLRRSPIKLVREHGHVSPKRVPAWLLVGQTVRWLTSIVADGRVRTRLQQQAHNLAMALACRNVEGGVAAIVPRVVQGAPVADLAGQKLANEGTVTRLCSQVQLGVHVGIRVCRVRRGDVLRDRNSADSLTVQARQHPGTRRVLALHARRGVHLTFWFLGLGHWLRCFGLRQLLSPTCRNIWCCGG